MGMLVEVMQGAGRAAWPFHASDWQHGSAPGSTARLSKLLFLGFLDEMYFF